MANPLKLIESFGDRYIKEHIETLQKRQNDFKSDWFQALDFFLSHVYYQGRNDDLSWRYYDAAKKALLTYFGKDTITQLKNYNNAWDNNIIPHDPDRKIWLKANNDLLEELKREKAGKGRDIEMVIDTLRFIHGCPSYNIVLYSIEEIKQGRIKKLYSEIDNIWQVGQKTASFYLRDLIFCYDLKLETDDYFTIQPIDTWVKQVAIAIGISSEKDSNESIAASFLKACTKENADPKKVNAGAWYLGANAFNILLDNILHGKSVV